MCASKKRIGVSKGSRTASGPAFFTYENENVLSSFSSSILQVRKRGG